ncbi:hypothetical protein AHF37_12484 [Paragonimus kellicotti]|nr:hypothetical protein AHF37_12484 [Paragonimus kellicotti]
MIAIPGLAACVPFSNRKFSAQSINFTSVTTNEFAGISTCMRNVNFSQMKEEITPITPPMYGLLPTPQTAVELGTQHDGTH